MVTIRLPGAKRRISSNILKINWANRLTDNLIFAAVPIGNTMIDLVSGAIAIQNNASYPCVSGVDHGVPLSTSVSPSDYIKYVSSSGNVASGLTFSNQTSVDKITDKLTAFALAYIKLGVSSAIHCVTSSNEFTATGLGFGLGIDDYYYAGHGKVMVGYATAVADLTRPNPTENALTSDPKGKWHFFGGSSDSTNCNFYSSGNGLKLETSVSSVNLSTNQYRKTFILRSYSKATDTVSCGLVLYYNEMCSLEKYARLHQNPWQIFSKPSRKFYLIGVSAPQGQPTIKRIGGIPYGRGDYSVTRGYW